MRKDFFRKGMILGIIFLFVGTVVVPSFESYKTNNNQIENQFNEYNCIGDLEKLNDYGMSLSDKKMGFLTNDNWVQVIYPNGGEILHGTTITYWDYEAMWGVYYYYFKIYCVGQSTGTYILSSHWEDTDGLFNTAQVPDGKYKIKVELWGTGDWQNPEPSYIYALDYSDNWFTIDNNNKPNTPDKPSGPTEGEANQEYFYTTSTIDNNDDLIYYFFDWGDGTDSGWFGPFESNEIASASNRWEIGTYNVRVQAKDEHETLSHWSDPLVVFMKNSPPNKPDIPEGPTEGVANQDYIFNCTTTDPQNDDISYQWDWGDEISGWLGPYDSGDTVTVSHVWDEKGDYNIKVKAKDVNGEESPWSDPLPITMPKNKAINPFTIFLERLMERFPILEQILQPIYDKLAGFY